MLEVIIIENYYYDGRCYIWLYGDSNGVDLWEVFGEIGGSG